MTLQQRVKEAGFSHLWENYDLRYAGVLHFCVPQQLTRPAVLTPDSAEPIPGPYSYYRLTPAQHRELLVAMFGEDDGK